MNDKIISFETAKLAKEKGFDGKIDNWYRIIDDSNKNLYGRHAKRGGLVPPICQSLPIALAPTQSILMKWLREKHGIYIWAIPVNGGKSFNHELEDLFNRATETEQLFSFDHKTYEDAIEFGLIKALQLI